MFSFLFRDGRVQVGDEIINVCGKRLRGLSIDEAIKSLKQAKRELDIVVARETREAASAKTSEKHLSTFLDEDRLRDEHLRIAQKINDYHETCSEVNLSSTSHHRSKNGEKSRF